MKKLHFYLVIALYFSVIGIANAQKTVHANSATLQRRQVNYNALVADIHTIKEPARDTIKPTTSFKLAKFYAEKNIYPTQSSVAFIYKMNPQLDASKPVPEGYKIKTLHFTPAPQALLEKSKADYEILKVPNPSENDLFFSQSKAYEEKLAVLQKIMKFTNDFIDTTQQFKNIVLPGIREKAGIICAAQMQYFNLELRHILELMNGIIQTRRYDSRIPYSINQMIGDIMQITGFGQVKSTEKKKDVNYKRSKDSKESYSPVFDISHFYTPWENPPNVDIYVYKNTSSGDQDTLPVMNAYEVYYDSNGYTYSLSPGCDTLSFFTIHPLNPASTLPLVLGKGNYCFILKDKSTGKISFHPNINLSSGTYDENNRVAIPFCIDDDN